MCKILPNRFGKSTYLLIENNLRKMANASTEEECNDQFNNAKRIIRTTCSDAHEKMILLNELYEERCSFSLYSIRNIPGSRGRRGSTSSESNHSSLVIHLNGGQKSVSEYTEHPATMFRDLLSRQANHIKKWNEKLFNQGNEMKVEMNRLLQSSPRNGILEKAAGYLCLPSYYRFKEAVIRSKDYVSYSTEDEEGNVECIVQSKRYDSAPPRSFKLKSDGFYSRCTCARRKGFQEQCVHEIIVYEGFVHLLFAEWHKKRSCVTCSESPVMSDMNIHSIEPSLPTLLQERMSQRKSCKLSLTPVSKKVEYSSDSSHDDTSRDVTYREWQKVQRELDGAFRNAGSTTKTKVMALQLEIRNALHLDGQVVSSSLVKNDINFGSNVDDVFQNIVNNYRKSFSPQKGNFNPLQRSIAIPSHAVRSRQPHKRLLPMSERVGSSFRKNKKVKPTCGFCREENHRIGTCPKKDRFKSVGEEFVLCNDSKSKYACRQLIDKLETCRNVLPWDYRTNAIRRY